MSKTIEVVLSERGDIWIETWILADDETLRKALFRHHFPRGAVIGVPLDKAAGLRHGMTVQVRLPDRPTVSTTLVAGAGIPQVRPKSSPHGRRG